MKKKILIGSIIAVALLTLVSFSSVVGKVSLNEELVDYNVEFSGLGKKHTVQLTQEEADEVELLFDDIEQQLSKVETREEAEEIFKEAVVELDKYGLLGGLSVRQAQRLVTRKTNRLLEKDWILSDDSNNNYMCLLLAKTILAGDYGVITGIAFFIWLILLIRWANGRKPTPNLEIIQILLLEYGIYYKPIKFLNIVTIYPDIFNDVELLSLYTIGLNGIKTDKDGITVFIGFTGLKIHTNLENWEAYYLGCALAVN